MSDDRDEGELKETPSRGEPKGADKPKRRMDDPDQEPGQTKTVEVGGEVVEIIEDLDPPPKDEKPAKRAAADKDDEPAPDEKPEDSDETRTRKRRRHRREGRAHDRAELRELMGVVTDLRQQVVELKSGQKANEEQTEETLLANTKAALNDVLARRAQAFADNEPEKANSYDEAAYRLRKQRDDLEGRIEQRGKGGDKATTTAATPRWSQAELDTIQDFRDDHPWIDPKGTDRDSRKAIAISAKMGEEGWRPSDPDWAEELQDRLKEAMPHRFEEDETPDDRRRQPTRKAPPVGSRGREGGAGGGTRQFRLTAIHKQTLAESGHEPGSPEYNSIIASWIKDAERSAKAR